MGWGGKRNGSGRKPKPLALRLIEGTFRKDRHGERGTTVAAMPTLDRMSELLLDGPWSVNLTLATMPNHTVLLGLWQERKTELLAEAKRRGIEAWFIDRDEFVRMVER